jgi:hypothetical protein
VIVIATDEWFWEGNVVNLLVRHLTAIGWTVSGVADTLSKATGTDIIAERGIQMLLVEVKGWPSNVYRNPARAHEVKSTAATNQAQQWFSHALLKAMRLQAANEDAQVALGFPDFPRYRKLVREVWPSLVKLSVLVFLVAEDGSVVELGAEEAAHV